MPGSSTRRPSRLAWGGPHRPRFRHGFGGGLRLSDFIRPVAQAVARGEFDRGIVLGGSGNGEAIVANREKGVRCGVCWSEQTTIWSWAHNDANCISIGERTITVEQALAFVRTPRAQMRRPAMSAKLCANQR